MHQEMSTQDAIALIIETQKNLATFYQGAATLVENPQGQGVFDRLAEETRSRLAHFYHLNYGEGKFDFDSFMATPLQGGSAKTQELNSRITPNLNDSQARDLAMQEEQDIEQRLQIYASRVLNPVAREILLQAASEIGRHAQIIESEYARNMRMIHETDINTFVRE